MITAGARYDDGSYRRNLPSIRVNRVGEEDGDHVYAPTAYTADDGANRSSRVNLQAGAILHLPRGRRDRNPGYVCWNRQADPRMLDAHQAVHSRELYGQPKVALSFKTRMVKAEPIEALLYGCSTWTLRQEHYAKLRPVHHRVLLRIIGAQRKRPDHRMTSYNRALEITPCESIETTLRTRRLLWAGTLLRMSGGRLPKRIMFGNLEGAVRRERGGEEKEWTHCVTERHPGVWHNGGLENDGVKG